MTEIFLEMIFSNKILDFDNRSLKDFEYNTKRKIINDNPRDELCNVFSGNGLIDCLRYAHENGCQLNKYTC